jgi:signal transduction histidine kinase
MKEPTVWSEELVRPKKCLNIAVLDMRDLLAKAGIGVEEWLEGTGVSADVTTLTSARWPKRIEYYQMVILYGRFVKLLGGVEKTQDFVRANQDLSAKDYHPTASRATRFVVDYKSLNRLLANWFFPMAFPMFRSAVEFPHPGVMKGRITVEEGYTYADHFLRDTALRMESASLVLGLRRGMIQNITVSDQGMEVDVFYPESELNPFRRFLQRLFRPFARGAIVDQLQKQQRDLIDANDRLQRLNADLEERVEERGREIDRMRAEQAQRSKMLAIGHLAGGVAHEINNPLAIIQLGTRQAKRLAEASGELDRAQLVEAMSRLEKASQRVATVVDGLELLSGVNNESRETFNFGSLVESVAELYRERCREKGIRFEVSGPSETVSASGRQSDLSQAIAALITNAIEACESIEDAWVRVEYGANQASDRIEFHVFDNGPGVRDEPERIFEPFFTTKDPGTQTGAGLGLSLALNTVREHRGWIDLVETGSGKTHFRATLPLAEGAKSAA